MRVMLVMRAMRGYARLCAVMRGYARLCAVIRGSGFRNCPKMLLGCIFNSFQVPSSPPNHAQMHFECKIKYPHFPST